VATFTATTPQVRAEFIPATPAKTQDLSEAKRRLAVLLQPVIRSRLSRMRLAELKKTTPSTSTSEKKMEPTDAAIRIQRSARRWLSRHRTEQREKSGTKMTQEEASRIIQERSRRWLDSTGFTEAKKARKHKKKGKKQNKEEQPAESKLEHFGRLVREARGELPEEGSAATTDKAHLSAPAKAHLVEMIQNAAEAIKNIDESKLPKLTEADLYRPVHEPVPVARPEPTHTQQESGQPGHYIQQPRA